MIDALLLRYVETVIYRAIVENAACEQSARMTAMKAATDNADRMIDELTLLPYYTGFQPEGVSRRARIAMKSGQTDGLFDRLGMAAFRVGRVTRLRFCPECLREMQARYGETYWRRDRQLPGVLLCP